MPELAPWENPDLPAPFATIEREVEGRARRFALWHWDERVVWRDLERPSFWWATQDVAGVQSDWERAIETARFGRAFTSECNKAINGRRIGLWSACTLHLSRAFHVIVGANGAGVAREKAGELWLPFVPMDDVYTLSKRAKAPSVWHPNREFFGVNREIMRAFAPILLERMTPGLRAFMLAGERSIALKTMKDLLAWNVSRQTLFDVWVREHRALYLKILAGFDLPEESSFGAHGERKQINGVQLRFTVASEYQRWSLQTSIALAVTMHELLELQLRLRDALRPILTDAEIAEILGI